MRESRFTNVMLTLNALLLGALLLSQLGVGAPKSASAVGPEAALNSAKILLRTADGVERLERSLRDVEKQLQSGAMRIMVTNLDEVNRGN